MVPYLGDFKEDQAVYILFNTFTSDDPSASSTITNLIDTDIHIHKDGAVAQHSADAAADVSINFDGITGNHLCKINTDSDAFFAIGSDYMVRMEGTTVDGATINAWIGSFSIENRHNEVDVVKWLGQACHAVSENGVPKVDLDQIAGVAVATGTAQLGVNVVNIGGTAQTGNDNGADINTILVDTDELQGDWVNGGRLDLLLDACALEATVAALNNISTAQVNAEVVDALNVDTYTEPGQGAPAVTASLVAKLGHLYKYWRNKTVTDATTIELYNDAGAVVDQKSTISDDGTDFTKGEFGTGP